MQVSTRIEEQAEEAHCQVASSVPLQVGGREKVSALIARSDASPGLTTGVQQIPRDCTTFHHEFSNLRFRFLKHATNDRDSIVPRCLEQAQVELIDIQTIVVPPPPELGAFDKLVYRFLIDEHDEMQHGSLTWLDPFLADEWERCELLRCALLGGQLKDPTKQLGRKVLDDSHGSRCVVEREVRRG